MENNKKIIITGTGRCGTSFLIMLFILLGLDTGFTRENYRRYFFIQCKAGLEKPITDQSKYLKNPYFILQMDDIYKNLELVIIPLRDLNEASKSRNRNGNRNGGLWGAKNINEQKQFYEKILSNYLVKMVQFNIPTIFLDFEKMIIDSKYLFQKLEYVMKKENINYEYFENIFNECNKFIQNC